MLWDNYRMEEAQIGMGETEGGYGYAVLQVFHLVMEEVKLRAKEGGELGELWKD